MTLAPQTATAFSEAETALMRDIYLLASQGLAVAQDLDARSKYSLARIIIYIILCEKRSGDVIDRSAIAAEAIEIMLNSTRPPPIGTVLN